MTFIKGTQVVDDSPRSFSHGSLWDSWAALSAGSLCSLDRCPSFWARTCSPTRGTCRPSCAPRRSPWDRRPLAGIAAVTPRRRPSDPVNSFVKGRSVSVRGLVNGSPRGFSFGLDLVGIGLVSGGILLSGWDGKH